MEVRAISRSVRMSPRKVRLVADAIRKLTIAEAFQVLEATQKRSGDPIMKTLKSAIANARVNNNIDEQSLMISEVLVNEGQALKRFHPSSRGRVHPYKKKSSHITIVLKEKPVKAVPTAKAVKADDKKQKIVKNDKPAEAKTMASEEGGKK